MDRELAKGILESLLFVSEKPLTIESISNVLGNEISDPQIEELLMELQNQYSQNAIQLVQIAQGYQFKTKTDYAYWIKRFFSLQQARPLSQACLEVLAMVAYKQPITRIEIEQLRGVDSSGPIKTLLEKKLIRITGRKKLPGRPIVYGTTKRFLEYFGLRDLNELPDLKEFEENSPGLQHPL